MQYGRDIMKKLSNLNRLEEKLRKQMLEDFKLEKDLREGRKVLYTDGGRVLIFDKDKALEISATSDLAPLDVDDLGRFQWKGPVQ